MDAGLLGLSVNILALNNLVCLTFFIVSLKYEHSECLAGGPLDLVTEQLEVKVFAVDDHCLFICTDLKLP